jgi:hypothetical protein
MIRRVQIQSHDVAHLCGQERIGGEFESKRSMAAVQTSEITE